MLSKVGKEVLIKAIAQAIPTYTMSYFKLPDSLLRRIEEYDKKFLMGAEER